MLVVFSLYVIWRDIQGTIDNALQTVDEVAAKKIGENWTSGSPIPSLRDENRKLYRTVEFILLAVGTAISGYGDLFNSFTI